MLPGHSAAETRRPKTYHKPVEIEKKWQEYNPWKVNFRIENEETEGAKIYRRIIQNPEEYIADNARRVIQTLYFDPSDSIPALKDIDYVVRPFEGVSYKSGAVPRVRIDYSTNWIEKSFEGNDTLHLDYETRGVIYHELTHAFQLEPQGCGKYDGKSVFWSFIEGLADAVRVANGCFEQDFSSPDRPRGGSWMSGYRITGYFLYWLQQTKDKDFIRKFNRTALTVAPWSWDEAMYAVLGREKGNSVAELWEEYRRAIGDPDTEATTEKSK